MGETVELKCSNCGHVTTAKIGGTMKTPEPEPQVEKDKANVCPACGEHTLWVTEVILYWD